MTKAQKASQAQAGTEALLGPAPALKPYRLRRKLLAAAVFMQVAILAGLACRPATIMLSARVLTFDTVPVDPWDIFRGDYITLAYPFSLVPAGPEIACNKRVYTLLRRDAAGKWQAVTATPEKPTAGADEVILEGKVVGQPLEKQIRVRYGIEQVFVSEGRGKNVNSGGNVQADVAVAPDGRAVIKEVRHNKDIIYRWRLM